MIFELLADMVKIGFIVFCLYAVFRAYVHWQQPARAMLLERRRLSVVSALLATDAVWAQNGPMMSGGMWGGGWMGGYGGIWGLILLVIVVAGVVAWAVKRK